MRVVSTGNNRSDRIKFFYYSLYGWFLPLLFTGIIFLAYHIDYLSYIYKPHIGHGTCFFLKLSNAYDHILFFVLPVGFLILINIILFIKTVRYYFQVKSEINGMKDTSLQDKEKKWKIINADKEKLMMVLKLFIIMGVSWSFEVFSSAFKFPNNKVYVVVELIWDIFNGLDGVFIFCIFMLKQKVFVYLKKRFLGKRWRPTESNTTSFSELYTTNRKISEVRLGPIGNNKAK